MELIFPMDLAMAIPRAAAASAVVAAAVIPAAAVAAAEMLAVVAAVIPAAVLQPGQVDLLQGLVAEEENGLRAVVRVEIVKRG